MKRIGRVSGNPVGDPQTYAIIGAAMAVHRVLGAGFLEPVYQAALEVELEARGIPHDREVELPVYYNEAPLGVRYRADFVCYGRILVELKSLEKLTPREEAQVIHYLLAGRLGRGLLLNFGGTSLQYKRFVGRESSSFQSDESSPQSVKSVDPVASDL